MLAVIDRPVLMKKITYALPPSPVLVLPGVPAGSDYALMRLVKAIVTQAVADARRNDVPGMEARRWLAGSDCGEYCCLVGVDQRKLIAWIRAGCPEIEKVKVKHDRKTG